MDNADKHLFIFFSLFAMSYVQSDISDAVKQLFLALN